MYEPASELFLNWTGGLYSWFQFVSPGFRVRVKLSVNTSKYARALATDSSTGVMVTASVHYCWPRGFNDLMPVMS